MIGHTTFCDKNNLPESCTSQKICTCTHRLKISLNRYVEMVIVDETTSIALYSHPFHIHGISFYVLEMGQHPDKIPMTVELAKTMNLGRNMTSPQATRQYPLKDTISIPSRGFVRIRFKATNPGFWFMHCHYESHMATGMNLVLQVGETHQMLEIPENFPKCGNYESGFLQNFSLVRTNNKLENIIQ
ncbi:CLUMA_CG010353, isoform B [Clunio marinus]|uniref:CLUMA_CG010353, isoform B n=1 Tax=Clunio marinus TaxID=568069 RepID=A0A1J1I9H4_9DIPT|nr:CLUMA_CG010353, isoform B [Clunio marinus]